MATVQNGSQKEPSEKSAMRRIRETELLVLVRQLSLVSGVALADDDLNQQVIASFSDSELHAQIEEVRDTLRTLGGVVRRR